MMNEGANEITGDNGKAKQFMSEDYHNIVIPKSTEPAVNGAVEILSLSCASYATQ
jgi:hypothetical protein